MKKVKPLLIFLLIISIFIPINVLAIGSFFVDNNDITIVKGKNLTKAITLNNAAGRINISSSNKEVADISEESIFVDNETVEVTINALSLGNTELTISAYDVSTYDFESLDGETYKINITVIDNGDMNKNGSIDLNDIIAILKKYLQIIPLEDDDIEIADMNGNEEIDIGDVIILLKKYLEVE